MTLKELLVKIGFDVDEAGFAGALVKVDLLHAGFDKLKEIVGEIPERIKELTERSSKLKDTSEILGIGIESLQAFQGAAQLAGVGTDELTNALAFLGKTVGEARTGNEQAQETFAKFGISLKGAHGEALPLEQVFSKISQRLRGMKDGTVRLAAAQDLLGKAGKGLLPVVADTHESLDDMVETQVRLGTVTKEDTIRMMAAYGRVTGETKQAIGSMIDQALAPLIIWLSAGAKKTNEWIKENRQLIGSKIDKFMDRLLFIMTKLKAAVTGLVDALPALGRLLGYTLVIALGALLFAIVLNIAGVTSLLGWYVALGVGSAVAAAKAAGAWLLAAAPFVIMAGLFIIILLAIDEVVTALRGGETAMDRYGGSVDKLVEKLLKWSSNQSDLNPFKHIAEQAAMGIIILTHFGEILDLLGSKMGTIVSMAGRMTSLAGAITGNPALQAIGAAAQAGGSAITAGGAAPPKKDFIAPHNLRDPARDGDLFGGQRDTGLYNVTNYISVTQQAGESQGELASKIVKITEDKKASANRKAEAHAGSK